ncbi:MAG: MxaJ protein [Gammaproteobacteria bacterium]|nr:MAG: MxaJ protein [Gammaproteobacteria bacterium]
MITTSVAISAGEFKPLKGQTAVRVCADAYNLPYSNKQLEGFDNKIAAIIGEELGIPVEYYWFPQRIGFARNTLKKIDYEAGRFLCDMAMSIPASPGLYSPTTAYYSSIDAMVYRTGEGYELNKISDIAKVSNETKKLRIGLFDRATATNTLLENGLEDQIDYFQMMSGDVRENAGRIITDELATGNIDVAFVWGPIAAYYADHSDVDMTVVPLNEFSSDYIFNFSLGLRHQDKAWKELLNKILAKRKDDIASIIAEYNFPSLENVEPGTRKKRKVKDDDD